ncbi:MAG: DEAD/DEAH box helicase [Nanoarchaeota archaeon]|nr:DEAD/DEAH box helicase [Nanoarchaeota archaeon]
MENFRKLGLIEPILNSLQEQNFKEPSEIQEKTIPLILEGKDIIAGAATGSGKTLAFASGIIKNSEKGKGIQAIVLTPTRELAEQVAISLQRFSKDKQLNIVPIYGGVSMEYQLRKLTNADVIVATPGRMLDHLARRTIRLDNVKVLVLDEADRMLDMGFQRDVGKIISYCPVKRQTLLFSATISEDISRLASRYMNNPIRISAQSYVDSSKLTQFYCSVRDQEKFSLLVHYLKNEKADLAMVFCNTQRKTEFISANLKKLGIDTLSIHGGYSQNQRSRAMSYFASGRIPVLICTDIAARGLDIKGISHIYNYDIPADKTDYVHRIGRTARAGNEGKVINLIGSNDYENFGQILQNKSLKIEQIETPELGEIIITFGRSEYSGGNNRGRGGYSGRSGGRSDSRRSGGGYGGRSSGSSGRNFRRR